MRVAVSSEGTTLEDRVHEQFGRCTTFLIVDTDTMECKDIENRFADSATGAGTACAEIIFNEQVQAVISGQVGPKAYEALRAGDVSIYLSPPGISAREAVRKYCDGLLRQMELQRF